MATITDLTSDPTVMSVTWDDGSTSRYPWIWLRDHAHDEASFHPVTNQRNVHTAAVPRDITAKEVRLEGSDVRISWTSDDEDSTLPVAFLAEFKSPTAVRTRPPVEPVLWDSTTIFPTPSTPYDDIMNTDEGLRDWLTKVASHGFALATGVPATGEATEELIRRVAYVRQSIFGGFWEFTADLAKADTAYTNVELLSHTDGTYSNDAPVQLLHCLYFEGEGGESTMADSFNVAAKIKERNPEYYELLSTVQVPGQYIGDGSHLMSSRPVLRHDHNGELVQVSFNNGDRAPFLLPEDEMVQFYDAIRMFDEIANDPAMQWRHTLAPGEAMLFDNWHVMHGRMAYSGRRKLCGAYLNHEDFESKLRMVSAK